MYCLWRLSLAPVNLSQFLMEKVLETFPCREKQIKLLDALFGKKNEPVPAATYIYGQSSVGKTGVVIQYLRSIGLKIATVNCIECYTDRLLLEPILSSFLNSDEVRCDTFMDFVLQLKIAASQGYFNNKQIIVLDGIEYLQNENYFNTFSNLQELTQIFTLGVVFISNILPEKFISASFITVYFPQYTKDELMHILKTLKPYECSDQFYENYLNAALSVFLRTTRDLIEMKNLVLSNFDKYCEPIVNGKIQETDIGGLWRHVAPHLKSSLNSIYLGIPQLEKEVDKELITNKTVSTLDLPYYAKYLLIAAYLASYNSPKNDKRLFVKNHGKQKKRVVHKLKEKVPNELIGPKAFSIDRLLAIFYSIMEEKASLTVNLMTQISSLVEIKLLSKSGDGQIDRPKYKCLAGYDCVELVAKTLGFNTRKYLM